MHRGCMVKRVAHESAQARVDSPGVTPDVALRLPAHAGHGLGAMLIGHLGALADAEDRPALTLTTFRDAPWNAPYYRRLGFVTLDAADQGPQLAAIVLREAASIPGNVPRVAMRRSVPVLTRGGVRER